MSAAPRMSRAASAAAAVFAGTVGTFGGTLAGAAAALAATATSGVAAVGMSRAVNRTRKAPDKKRKQSVGPSKRIPSLNARKQGSLVNRLAETIMPDDPEQRSALQMICMPTHS